MARPLLVVGTGSRGWRDVAALDAALLEVWHDAAGEGWSGIEVWHGACPEGFDFLLDGWCRAHGVPVEGLAADWDACGEGCPSRPHRVRRRRGDRLHPGSLPDWCPVAGPRRNRWLIGRGPGLVVAAPLGVSRGTRGCMALAEAAGVPVWEVTPS